MKLLTSLQTLRVFESCARYESFSQAGGELGITTGAVSQHIKTLETRLGFAVFYRLGRGVKLTASGKNIYLSLIKNFQAIDDTIEQERQKQRDNQLVISVQPGFAVRFLFVRLGDFQAQHPDIDVTINTVSQPADFSLYHAHGGLDYRLYHESTTMLTPLFREHMFPVCSPGFYRQQGFSSQSDAIIFQQLPQLPLLWDESPMLDKYGYTWRYWAAKTGGLLTPPKQQRYSLSNVTLQLAELGHGIALGRCALVIDAINSGLLVPVFRESTYAVPNPFVYALCNNPEYGNSEKFMLFKRWLQMICHDIRRP